MLEEQSMIRQIVDLSVAAGRQLQNSQTGMLHLHYQTPKEESAVTIPLVENFLFALALCRTRLADNIQEAKQLIGHLLNFQLRDGSPFEGNFPIYLHEYPICNERALGCSLLPIFCRLLKDFHVVLGAKLVADLEGAADKLLAHGFRAYAEKPFSIVPAVQLAVGGMALGKDEGKRLEQELIVRGPCSAWGSPEELGHLVTTLRLVYPNLADSPWKELHHFLIHTYDPQLCCYAGPMLNGFQSGDEPQATLYDLLFGQIPRRVKESREVLLYGALVDETTAIEVEPEAQGELQIEDYQTSYARDQAFCFSSVTGGVESKHPQWKGINDLAVLWKGRETIHSFVCQRGGTLQVRKGAKSGQFIVTFVVEEGEEEVSFYLDKNQGCVVHVDDVAANSFLLGEKVAFKSASMEISMVFECVEGDGAFRGHVMLGNRPSQLEIKGQKRFNAYDWKVFLRRLRGKGPCKVNATLTFQKVEW